MAFLGSQEKIAEEISYRWV